VYIGIWVHPKDLCLDVLERTFSNIVGFLGGNAISVFMNNMNFTKMNLLFTYDGKAIGYSSRAGGLFFEPNAKLYRATSIRPYRYRELLCFDLRHVVNRAYSYGLEVVAHVNCLNMGLEGNMHYMVDDRGEPVLYGGAWVCPLDPNVRRYLIGLTEDLATREEVAEIEIGEYWHPISPLMRDRITCFCKYCRIEAKDRGINLDSIISRMRKDDLSSKMRRFMNKVGEEPFEEAFTFRNYDKLKSLVRYGSISEFINFRIQTTTELIDDMVTTAHDYGVRVSALVPPPDIARSLGVDYRAISKMVNVVKPVLYHRMLRRDVKWFSKQCVKARKLSNGMGYPAIMVLEGMNLREIMLTARKALDTWKEGIMIHSYSLASLEGLEIVKNAINEYEKRRSKSSFWSFLSSK